MDPNAIALAATPLIAEAIQRIGDDALSSLTETLGAEGWDRITAIARRVRTWLHNGEDQDANDAWDDLAANPESLPAAANLAERLTEILSTDIGFAQELESLLHEAEGSPNPDEASLVVRASGAAKIGKVIQIGTVNTHIFNA